MRWAESDLVTLGYVAIRPRRAPPGFGASPYVVCSPASCLVDEPEGWSMHAELNAVWMLDRADAVRALLAADQRAAFVCLGLRGLPVQFGAHPEGWDLAWPVGDARAEPIPPHFVRLGYDVCCRYGQATLEHSPLSCNGFADELGANAWCLLPTLAAAVAAAERFAREGVAEPGPYVVLEVWAERPPRP